ncbi:hypothetical protein ACA910_016189 [Epithemia clementina (nom. ined.)]
MTIGNKRFRYVAVDLDGTLLNSEHKVSPRTIEYIQQLDAKGFGIMVATGRSLNTVYETILALDLPNPIPVVCSNGARGVMCKPRELPSSSSDESIQDFPLSCRVESEPLFDTPVPEPVARRSITLSKEMGFMSQFYVGDEIYADPTNESHYKHVEMYKELTGAKTICVDNMITEVLERYDLPSKQVVLFHKEQQDGAMLKFEETLSAPEFRAEDGSPPTLVRGSFGWFLEVLHPHVNKGNGLKRMCTEHLNIDLDSVVAFGDGDNDAEFLQMAGWGVAMKNARPIVKQVADQTIDFTNNEDGVRKTLESMESSGQLIFASP